MSPRPKLRRHSPQDRAYLRMLADKIRDARAQRGMTRNALAADSGVSLRFLAQLEGGQGNPSVLVLRRIASAMGFAPEWLLSDEPMQPIDQTLPMRVLKRLSQQDRATGASSARFSRRCWRKTRRP
jgi:XRE family aerobic/anaerobic benzoate catabolism transcriptional regulator